MIGRVMLLAYIGLLVSGALGAFLDCTNRLKERAGYWVIGSLFLFPSWLYLLFCLTGVE